jgi:hypothetical protein
MYAQRIPVGKLDWLSNRNSGYPLTPVAFAAAFQSRKSSPFERIARDQNATNCLPQFCTWQGHIQLSRLPGRVREAIWLAHARRPVADATSRGIRPFAKNWPRSQRKSVQPRSMVTQCAEQLPIGLRNRARSVSAKQFCAQHAVQDLFFR